MRAHGATHGSTPGAHAAGKGAHAFRHASCRKGTPRNPQLDTPAYASCRQTTATFLRQDINLALRNVIDHLGHHPCTVLHPPSDSRQPQLAAGAKPAPPLLLATVMPTSLLSASSHKLECFFELQAAAPVPRACTGAVSGTSTRSCLRRLVVQLCLLEEPRATPAAPSCKASVGPAAGMHSLSSGSPSTHAHGAWPTTRR